MTSLPAALTGARILIACWIAFAAPASPVARVALALTAALTDGLDGSLARRWRVTSRAGAALDLAADGLFFLACAILFWREGLWPAWLLAALITSALPQAVAQVVLVARTGRAGSPGRWWNKLSGGVAYGSVLAVMAGLPPVACGISQAAIAWMASLLDLAFARRRNESTSIHG